MYEVLPILAGALTGLAVARLDGWRFRAFVVVPAAVAIGVLAAVASGEIEENWVFVLWDAAQALAAAILVTVVSTHRLLERGDRTTPEG
jgi:hypothetical protein